MPTILFWFTLVATIIYLRPTTGIQSFENHKVYNVFIENSEKLKDFVKLNERYSINLLRQGVENGLPFYMTLKPGQQQDFEKDLTLRNITFDLLNENLQEILNQRHRPHGENEKMDWIKYHNLSTIYTWVRKISSENWFIRWRIIGLSAEMRPIYAVVVSKRLNNKAIFVESNIHAIEWISSAVSTCFLNHLITTNSVLLQKYDWIFIPVLNPDGFHYTHTKNPMWRKNRRYNGHRNSTGLCYGIDLNRNYNSFWGLNGYNLNVPCDHFYAGAKPESEPEVRAAVRFEKSFKKGYVRMHLALHSYGQLVLLPYGHTNDVLPENYDEMMEISAAFAKAAEAKYGFEYKYGTSGSLLGFVSGSSKDFWYTQGIPYSATIELRDRGEYGFFLPSKYIQPTCEEFTEGIYAMIASAEEKGLFN